jgi:hypothetical protein
MRRRLEKSIEKACKRWAQGRGWWCAKFKSPGKRSAPDDIFVRAGFHVFVEFKAEGEAATENQKLYHAEMRTAGATVLVVDNVAEFKEQFMKFEAAFNMALPRWLQG